MTDECPDHETLRRFLLGLLANAEAWAIEAHLSSCHDCTEQLEQATPRDDLWQEMRFVTSICLDDPEVMTLTGQLRALVPSRDSTVSFLGERAIHHTTRSFGTLAHYELLEVIGRGGMGIVYRAVD